MILSALAVLLTFGLVIFLHEFGHFIVCVKLGVRVERFAFGFGPELIGMTRGDTRFSICAIPLGGFVKPAGESLDDATGDPDEYFSRSPWQRLAIVAAGPAMNYILAFVIFFAGALIWGASEVSKEPVLGDFQPDMPAVTAGFQKGDRILKVDGAEIEAWDDFARIVHRNPGRPLEMQYAREGEVGTLTVTPRLDSASGKGLIGVVPVLTPRKLGIGEAALEGVARCWFFTAYTVEQIVQKIYRRERPDLAGPVGIVQMVSKAAHSGIENFVFLIGVISVAIGFFNILPIPLLDGGHGVLYLWEGLSRRKLTTQIVAAANSVGLVFLLSLLIFATFNDVMRIRDGRRAKQAAAAEKAAVEQAVPAPSK